MSTELLEVMPELFTRSEILVWDFSDIDARDEGKNTQQYIESAERTGKDPRDPRRRQAFNEEVLSVVGARYLIGRYGENRKDVIKGSRIEREGRTFHLAIDIFAKDKEPVFAPCDGEIVVSDFEPGEHNYGNYLIFRPDDITLPYIFFGHLADDRLPVGRVVAGQQIARLGSYEHLENGGWSVHLHLQLLTKLPPKGEAPIGYSTKENLPSNMKQFPDPQSIFPDWHIAR